MHFKLAKKAREKTTNRLCTRDCSLKRTIRRVYGRQILSGLFSVEKCYRSKHPHYLLLPLKDETN